MYSAPLSPDESERFSHLTDDTCGEYFTEVNRLLEDAVLGRGARGCKEQKGQNAWFQP